jgi:hypothetical protein
MISRRDNVFKSLFSLFIEKQPNGLADRVASPQGAPAADLNETRLRKIAFSAKWPRRAAAEAVRGRRAWATFVTIFYKITNS